MSAEKIPLVSVVIPLYNSARFITQTLESLAYQTLKDFEVVVVDDCSTDTGVALVEDFKRRSGGGLRLHVIKLPKNGGSPGLPRNVGIQFAHGKYIAFLDSDDLFTPTALEEFVTLAENFQAEVVHTDGFFVLDDAKFHGTPTEKLLSATNYPVVVCNPHSPRLNAPTLAPEDFAERVKLWLNSDYHWATWATFVKRDVLAANQISFPKMTVSDDMLMNFTCLCLAKKILRTPNINYLYRVRDDSASHDSTDLEKYFHRWLSNLNDGFSEFGKIMSRFKFFDEHADFRYAVLNWFFDRCITDAQQVTAAYAQIHPAAINPVVEKNFHPDDAAFAAYLFNTVNIQRLQIAQLQRELQKFHRQ